MQKYYASCQQLGLSFIPDPCSAPAVHLNAHRPQRSDEKAT